MNKRYFRGPLLAVLKTALWRRLLCGAVALFFGFLIVIQILAMIFEPFDASEVMESLFMLVILGLIYYFTARCIPVIKIYCDCIVKKYPFLPGAGKTLFYRDLDFKVVVNERINNSPLTRKRVWLLRNGFRQMSFDLSKGQSLAKYSLIPLPEGVSPIRPINPKNYRIPELWKTRDVNPVPQKGLLYKSRTSFQYIIGMLALCGIFVCFAVVSIGIMVMTIMDFTLNFENIFIIFSTFIFSISCIIGFIGTIFSPFSIKNYVDRFVKSYMLIPFHSKARYWREFDSKAQVIKKCVSHGKHGRKVYYNPYWWLMKNGKLVYEIDPDMLKRSMDVFPIIPLKEVVLDHIYYDSQNNPIDPPT